MFPRRAPQTAGHRLDFGLGPIGLYRALPIGPYIGPYVGRDLGPYLAALFSRTTVIRRDPILHWAIVSRSKRCL